MATSRAVDATAAQGQPATSQKPNILFVLMDNLGYGESGVTAVGRGVALPTPRIDRLATEDTRLTNFIERVAS